MSRLGSTNVSPLRAVAHVPCADTIAALEQLLHEARKGEVIGLAYAAMLRQRAYIVNTTGEAYRSPTFCRGMVAELGDRAANLTARSSL